MPVSQNLSAPQLPTPAPIPSAPISSAPIPPSSAGPAAAQAAAATAAPRIWLIQSDKAGDNAQLRVIADALPWPYEVKQITVREQFVLGKPTVSASLHHVDAAKSDPLLPPWPDLILTCGRRMSMVALWIQEQSKQAGAARPTKIVLVGMPKRHPERFDLAVMSGQYRPRQRDNTLAIDYPLQRIDEAAIARESDAWRDTFAGFAKPLTAVLVGGLTKAVRFDAKTAARLARDLGEMQRREGGSLIVVTSRRTPAAVLRVLERDLPTSATLYKWTAAGGPNPYRALLGLADRFVVTSDSISMQMEIACLGRPLAIYQLPQSLWMGDGPFGAVMERLLAIGFIHGLMRALAKAGSKIGLGHHRDISTIHRQLVEDGLAVWFGAAFRLDGRKPKDELPAVVARIVALLR
ncbi:MAG TPA: ELM1/GtrOC1 family putative glycosyltransferase [Dongiaceae bacterium]|nr:ELM1/GtrOC1 family putative glycosyltransferase [Dongiaceae bacterium]